MEFYEVINKRKTIREFTNKEVDFEKIKRILEAGNKAPTWNHNRNWQYVVISKDEEKENILNYAKKIVDKFDEEKFMNIPRPYPITNGQLMYGKTMPLQYSMLKDAPYVIIPVFKAKEISAENLSKLNPFVTIWCVIENIFLATTAEGLSYSMRIPDNEEIKDIKEKLKIPATYNIPVLIGIGYGNENYKSVEQKYPDLSKQIHINKWK